MAKSPWAEGKQPNLKYRQVKVDGLDKGRRGKHHDLVQGILRELETLSPGSAMQIPLSDVGGIGLANLRAAVHRASTTHGLEIETLADEKNLYVWKKKKDE
ncbi:MAG: hypothetical protein WBQ64_19950 [Terriglobales bacterium]